MSWQGVADAKEWTRAQAQGLRALAMPLFVHQGPLTTRPRAWHLAGASVCVQGAGNPKATGSLQGLCPLPPGGHGGRQLVSWDGGRLGFACAVGVVLSSGPGAQGREGPLHMWVSMAPRGDAPPPLRSDLEGVESGWGDGDPVRRRKGVHVRTEPGRRQPGSVFVGTRNSVVGKVSQGWT